MKFVHIYWYFIFKNKITISTNFLAFFQFFPSNFSFLDPDHIMNVDPDQGAKMNADPCRFRSTALVITQHYF